MYRAGWPIVRIDTVVDEEPAPIITLATVTVGPGGEIIVHDLPEMRHQVIIEASKGL
jgi:hypothetical protein